MIHEREPEQPHMEMSQLAEIYACDYGLFDDDSGDGQSINWHYCMKNATFSHKEACEFILHIGGPDDNTDEAIWKRIAQEILDYGCTQDFIDAYIAAKDAGAVWVLFYA